MCEAACLGTFSSRFRLETTAAWSQPATMPDRAGELARQRGCRWIELRHIEPLPLDLAGHTRKLVQTMPLAPDPATIWDGLLSKMRNHVRKAEKCELQCTSHGREAIPQFY